MNLLEELQSLDVNDVGRWPLPFRAAVIALVFLAVAFAGIWFMIVKDKAPQLARAEAEEQSLRVTFENKQRKAANYDAYRAQLAQIEQSFGTMLRQLPGETEIPSLIVDISQTGLAAQFATLDARLADMPSEVSKLCGQQATPAAECENPPATRTVVMSGDKMVVGELERVWIDPEPGK